MSISSLSVLSVTLLVFIVSVQSTFHAYTYDDGHGSEEHCCLVRVRDKFCLATPITRSLIQVDQRCHQSHRRRHHRRGGKKRNEKYLDRISRRLIVESVKEMGEKTLLGLKTPLPQAILDRDLVCLVSSKNSINLSKCSIEPANPLDNDINDDEKTEKEHSRRSVVTQKTTMSTLLLFQDGRERNLRWIENVRARRTVSVKVRSITKSTPPKMTLSKKWIESKSINPSAFGKGMVWSLAGSIDSIRITFDRAILPNDSAGPGIVIRREEFVRRHRSLKHRALLWMRSENGASNNLLMPHWTAPKHKECPFRIHWPSDRNCSVPISRAIVKWSVSIAVGRSAFKTTIKQRSNINSPTFRISRIRIRIRRQWTSSRTMRNSRQSSRMIVSMKPPCWRTEIPSKNVERSQRTVLHRSEDGNGTFLIWIHLSFFLLRAFN